MAGPRLVTGLRITAIHNQRQGASNTNEEWVRIANRGTEQWDVRGWLITDETDRQIDPHVYRLPDKLGNGQGWTFAPDEVLYLITGRGTDAFVARPSSGPPQFHFYWNRDAFVWNNKGDRVYLRHPNGQFATQPFPIP